jgi:hypothetical protein
VIAAERDLGAEGVLDPAGRGWCLAREVAKVGIAGVDLQAIPSDLWRPVLETVARERLTGLLVRGAASGVIGLSSSQMDDAVELHRRGLRRCLQVERTLIEIAEPLAAAGVAMRTLKGPAVAHQDYDDPSERLFRDLDVLVSSADLDSAVELLRTLGFGRAYAEPRPGFQRRYGKGVALLRPQGVEVDLHRTLALGPLGQQIIEADLWLGEDSVRIGALDVRTLDVVGRFLHACVHAATSPRPRLWVLRDVVQLHDRACSDVSEVRDRAARNGLEPALVLAVRAAEVQLGHVGPLSEWAASRPLNRRDALRLRAYGPGKGEMSRTIAMLLTAKGIRYRAGLAGSLLLPTADYLTGRGTTRRNRLRRVVSRIARREF